MYILLFCGEYSLVKKSKRDEISGVMIGYTDHNIPLAS